MLRTVRTAPAAKVILDKDAALDVLKRTADTTFQGGIGTPRGGMTLQAAVSLVEAADRIEVGRQNGQTTLELWRTGYGCNTLYVDAIEA